MTISSVRFVMRVDGAAPETTWATGTCPGSIRCVDGTADPDVDVTKYLTNGNGFGGDTNGEKEE